MRDTLRIGITTSRGSIGCEPHDADGKCYVCHIYDEEVRVNIDGVWTVLCGRCVQVLLASLQEAHDEANKGAHDGD